MAFGKSRATNYSMIYDEVSQLEIASAYLGIDRIPKLINSPLRKDGHASFGIYMGPENKVFYKDFATGESGDMVKLLTKLWNTDSYGVAERIYKDFNGKEKPKANLKRIYVKDKSNVLIDVRVREWEKHDLEYWESYGISKEWLDYAEVYPISHKFIVTTYGPCVFSADKYAYAFVERKDNKVSIKIYQPYNTDGFKWTSKNDGSVISLWTKIPQTGDKLVICSSLKDSLCFWANTGIPCIAMQGEGFKMKDKVIQELKSRFRNIYVLYDNDPAGIRYGEQMSEMTGFTNLVLPQFEGGKDVSDLYKAVGKNKFLTIIKQLL